MGKLKDNSHKGLNPKKRLLTNKQIVLVKVITVFILFFACSLFFFQNIENIFDELLAVGIFPIIFFAGIVWICCYIINLITKIEDQKLYQADRFNFLYRIIFTIVVISVVIRSFLFTQPYLSVTLEIIILFIISGIITLITPRIVDNNNDEF